MSDRTAVAKVRRRVDRRLWDLERFGFTPRKVVGRAASRGNPKLALISLPKAGTHLAERMLCLHPAYRRPLVGTIFSAPELVAEARKVKGGQLLCAHVRFSPTLAADLAELEVKTVLCLRDPRDVLVSRAHFIRDRTDHPFHALAEKHPDLLELISVLIEGEPALGVDPLRDVLLGYLNWIPAAAVTIRFEELTDPDRRSAAIGSCFETLGIGVRPDELDRISARLVSSASPTFRRGRSGEWSGIFDRATNDKLEAAVGDLLPELGYARSPDLV